MESRTLKPEEVQPPQVVVVKKGLFYYIFQILAFPFRLIIEIIRLASLGFSQGYENRMAQIKATKRYKKNLKWINRKEKDTEVL